MHHQPRILDTDGSVHAETPVERASGTKIRLSALPALLCGLTLLSALHASDARAHPDATPPIRWSVPDGEHVAWDVEAGFGVSAPVAIGDLLVALVEPETVVALDQATGAERWRVELSVFDRIDGVDAAAGKKAMATTVDYWRRGLGQKCKDKEVDLGPAKAAWKMLSRNRVPIISADRYKFFGYTWGDPDTDGTRIYVKFSSGSIAALNLDGSVAWRRRGFVGENAPMGAAPGVLAEGVYIYKDAAQESEIPADTDKPHRNYIVLAALDTASGEPKWRSPSFIKADHGEWGGLGVASVDGRSVIITPGGEVFDAADGKNIGSDIGHCGWGTTPSGGTNVAVFGSGVQALSLVDGRIPEPTKPVGSKLTQGTVCGDRAYAWNGGNFWIHDLTGKSLWRGYLQLGMKPMKDKKQRRNNKFRGPGAIIGDYFIGAGDKQTVAVVELADDRPKVVARNPMGGPIKAPPVGVGKRLFFRLGERIVAIE